jgi:hypothetical protein
METSLEDWDALTSRITLALGSELLAGVMLRLDGDDLVLEGAVPSYEAKLAIERSICSVTERYVLNQLRVFPL